MDYVGNITIVMGKKENSYDITYLDNPYKYGDYYIETEIEPEEFPEIRYSFGLAEVDEEWFEDKNKIDRVDVELNVGSFGQYEKGVEFDIYKKEDDFILRFT